MFKKICVFVVSMPLIMAAGLFGRFENVPQDALEAAKSGLTSPIVNGLNFQSRIDVRLVELRDGESPTKKVLPVNREYAFETPSLASGEYELVVNAYDFTVQHPRYRIVVNGDAVEAFVDDLASETYNASSKHVLTRETPLRLEITGFKNYYESADGKLTEMFMSSPFGFIFRSKLYSALFIATLVIMAFPYIIQHVSPEFAEEFQQMQAGAYQKPNEAGNAVEKIDTLAEKEVSAQKTSVRASRANRRR